MSPTTFGVDAAQEAEPTATDDGRAKAVMQDTEDKVKNDLAERRAEEKDTQAQLVGLLKDLSERMGRLEASQTRQEEDERMRGAAESSVFGSSLGLGGRMRLQSLDRTPPRVTSPATYFGAHQRGYGDAVARRHAPMTMMANEEMQQVPQHPEPQSMQPPMQQPVRQPVPQPVYRVPQQPVLLARVPDARQRKLGIRPFDGKELYQGLGTGFLDWGKRFVRQIQFAERASGFPWTEDVKVDVLGHHLTGMAERYYNRQVEAWWGEDQTLEHAMQRLLQTFQTKITPAQSMKLFTAAKIPKRSWTEHYLYLVAVSEACGGADNLVLDNIVHYAEPSMRSTMLARLNLARVDYLRQAEELAHFAQSTELELRGNKAMGRDVVNNVGETHKEKRKCYKCGEIGHLKATCPQLNRTDSVDFALTVGESHLGNSSDSWILDSGSSRHLVNDSSLLEDAEDFASECYVADGKALWITKRGSVVLHVKAMGEDRTVRLLDVQFAADLERNIISYGKLERKGYALTYRDGRRVLAPKHGGQPVMDVDMTNSVLVVRVGALRVQESARDVIMAVLAEREEMPDPDVQQGSLMHFHRRFGHLHYDTILRMAKIQASGIVLTDEKRENCLACAQGKQTKNRQSKKDTGRNSPVDVVGGVICSDLKGPMTPRDRLGNRYLVNFIDHRTNYCRVFLAKTKDAAALKFQQFLAFFERQFKCTVRDLRTDGGGEYQTLDLFCKSTGVARQVSEARNQASNGKAERMHRTIMNMVRSMVFACGLPLSFWGDAAEYAAFVLNRSPSKSNPGRQSPLQMLTRSMPDLGEIVAFGSRCTVHRDPSNKSLGERGKPGLIIGKSEETKGYRVYIPKDQVVIVTQHVANIETLSATQNEQLRRVHLGTDDQGDRQTQHPERTEETHSEPDTSEHTASETLASKKARHRGGWVRENHQTRSATRKAAEAAKEQPQGADVQEEPAAGVVNAVREPDPKNYGQAMRSERKSEWELAMAAELEALELNGVWAVVVPPNGSHLLHTKWVFKTKTDAYGAIERFKARLVACGNEQLYGVDYGVTFAAVMELSTVKVILVLARRWRVPAKHGDIPNAYVKADKEAHLEIFLRVPHGMNISDESMRELGVSSKRELALRLKKALYGLKQAGRLWSKLLHLKLMEAGFTQSITDMCLYYKREGIDLVVVGVYVDDLLVTATTQRAVDQFFVAMQSLSIKDLGEVSKFLGMRVELDDASGYTIDQEVAIDELLNAHGLADAHGVRTPIGEDCNDPASDEGDQLLPTVAPQGAPTLRGFQSLVGSLLWIARCTRPDISFAVHKATRQSHQPRVSDWKLAKRIARYLKGTKDMKLGMPEVAGSEHALDIASWSDADFAADKVDRKSVTGGVVTLNGVPVLWICKKQTGVSLSTMEAEFISASQVARELLGLRELLQELELQLVSPMPMWVDNQAAIAQLEAEGTTSRSKHIDIRLKFVCDFSRKGVVQAQYVESRLMIADLLTKALSAPRLAELRGLFNLKSCRMTMQQDGRRGQNCAVSEEEC